MVGQDWSPPYLSMPRFTGGDNWYKTLYIVHSPHRSVSFGFECSLIF